MIPPKYRVTTTAVYFSPCCFSTSSIGLPAVPLGSPSSDCFCHSSLSPTTYAEQLCVADQCFFLISSMNAIASCSLATGRQCPMNRDFLMTISVSAGALTVRYRSIT